MHSNSLALRSIQISTLKICLGFIVVPQLDVQERLALTYNRLFFFYTITHKLRWALTPLGAAGTYL